MVDEFLRVRGHPEVHAVGDDAAISDDRQHRPVPLLAQAAIQKVGWKLIHLARMDHSRNRLATALGWGLKLIQEPDTTQVDLAAAKSAAGSPSMRDTQWWR